MVKNYMDMILEIMKENSVPMTPTEIREKMVGIKLRDCSFYAILKFLVKHQYITFAKKEIVDGKEKYYYKIYKD